MRAWRWLRRMSTALYLLLILAGVTVVATFVPQEPVIPTTVEAWRTGADGPGEDVAAVFDRLGLFDIYGSWWFATLAVLLGVSLVSCLVPRIRGYVRTVRQPPAPGRNLRRLTHHGETATTLPPDEAVAAAEPVLRRRRLRTRRLEPPASPTGHHQLAAERGHAREGGSLAFHISFFVIVAGALIGVTAGFEAQINLVEGESFADAPVGYDAYDPGRYWSMGDHPGFTVRLDDFAASYHDDVEAGEGARGSIIAADFASRITVLEDGEEVDGGVVRVNEPFHHAGLSLYQIRFGFAPRIEVATSGGTLLADETTNLIEQGNSMMWTGVLPVERSEVDSQIALELVLLPDAAMSDDGIPHSRSNEPRDPRLAISLWYGPLGLEENRPPREFDREAGSRLEQPLILAPGETGTFEPLGLEVAFPDLPYWSGFQVAHEPGRGLLLGGAGLLLAGLIPSLYAYRRRVWVDVAPDGAGSRVVVAGVARHRSDRFAEQWPALRDELLAAVSPPATRPPDEPDPARDPAPSSDVDVPASTRKARR